MNISVIKLNVILLSVLGTNDLVEKWWISPNRAFDYQTPQEMLDKEPKTVIQYVLSQINGQYF